MKIGMNEINEGIYLVAVKKLKRSLENEGFSIVLGRETDMFDIYAEKNDDRRIYEIRIGKNKTQKRVLKKLQEVAKEKEAKLFVTYLEQPRTSRIEYEGLDSLLFEYLNNHIPEELDALSTHTMLENISDVQIDSISIVNEMIKVEGNANLEVELLYGSERDRMNGFGESLSDSFEFVYRVNIIEGKIRYAYFKFDLKHFYE